MTNLTQSESRQAAVYGAGLIVIGLGLLVMAAMMFRAVDGDQYLAALLVVAAFVVLVRGWLAASVAVGDDGSGSGPWWSISRVLLLTTRIPTPDLPQRPLSFRETLHAMMPPYHLWYVLFAGGLGLLNSLMLPAYQIEALYVGAGIGTLIFLRFWSIPRLKGIAYLLATAAWCYLIQDSELLNLLAVPA